MLGLLGGIRREPAGCVIKVGVGKTEITDLYPFLTGVTIDCSRTEAWTATLTFETRRDELGRWAVQDSGIWYWEPILIEATFGNESEEILRGYIREIHASYPEEAGAATVTVECQDDSFALDREHFRQPWGSPEAPTTDRMVFEQIIGRHPGLMPLPVADPGLTGLHLIQDSTDIHFLRERAEANGYELIFSRGEVYYGPMRLSGQPQPTILVYAGPGTNCLRLDVRADGHQPEKIGFQVAAPEGKELVDRKVEPDVTLLGPEPAAGGGPGLGEFIWRVRRPGTIDEAEITARAKGRINELSMRLKAEGELDGTLYGHVLRVGETVAVDGIGDRFNGLYYVDTVKHTFSTDGYRQSFKLLRNAYGDNVPGAAGGPLGGLSASLSASFSF